MLTCRTHVPTSVADSNIIFQQPILYISPTFASESWINIWQNGNLFIFLQFYIHFPTISNL